jgi:hypothetical protein
MMARMAMWLLYEKTEKNIIKYSEDATDNQGNAPPAAAHGSGEFVIDYQGQIR